jgi:hypothetical protein
VPHSRRVLGFGKHPENAAAILECLRDAGLTATNFALTDDAAGDARLIQELTAADYDGVLIGALINGLDPEDPPTQQRTLWTNRALNIVHAYAPAAKIILVAIRLTRCRLSAVYSGTGMSTASPRQREPGAGLPLVTFCPWPSWRRPAAASLVSPPTCGGAARTRCGPETAAVTLSSHASAQPRNFSPAGPYRREHERRTSCRYSTRPRASTP